MAHAGLRFFATNREMEHLGRRVRDDGDASAARDLRIKLQRGGYYFVDMDRYMSFYFGEVDATTMPADAIVERSDQTVFESFLGKPEIGRVVVCVHGFNVHLYEAHGWFRILTETMRKLPLAGTKTVTDPGDPPLAVGAGTPAGSLSAFIGFSWPSNGSVLAYNRDQLDAAASAQALASLIARMHVHGKKVDLICHSMGNFAACSMLRGLIDKTFVPPPFLVEELERRDRDCNRPMQGQEAYRARSRELLQLIDRGALQQDESVARPGGWFIENMVMIAADVERRHVTKAAGRTSESEYIGPFYSGLQHLVRRAHNFYSRFDGALGISSLEKRPKSALLAIGDRVSALSFGMLDFLERNPDYKWEARLGVGPHPVSAPPNVSSVNSTELAARAMDHSDHIDSREVAQAVASALELC